MLLALRTILATGFTIPLMPHKIDRASDREDVGVPRAPETYTVPPPGAVPISRREGGNLIRLGRSDQVRAGGVCTPVTRSMMPGFAMLSALTTRNDDPAAASRPFDLERDGFIMAEGCSLLVLEELEHARKRGARSEEPHV